MKKVLLIILSIIIALLVYKSEEKIIIPDDAIRFRVIANSDSAHDQEVKYKVKDNLQKELSLILKDTTDINKAKTLIKDNIYNLENIVENDLKNESYSYTLDYGMHYFPKKEYKGVIYEEGEYESLLVTLGEGNGKNWWCVLFPPMCLMEAEENNTDDVEYKSFIKTIIEKYF